MEAPPDLDRFVQAQNPIYAQVTAELRRGLKTTHWMWFIFPQLAALGRSSTAKRYGLSDLDEASAYLAHPVLGSRLRECCGLLLELQGRTAAQVFGFPDDLKLRSSVTLFAQAACGPSPFTRVLEHYYGGQPDAKTLQLLGD